MSNDRKKIVNIISIIRCSSNFAQSYINQISSQAEKKCEIGKIILICDDLISPSPILSWAGLDERVVLVQESTSDLLCDSLEDKVLQWADLANQGVEASLLVKSDFTLFIEADLCFPFDLVDELVLANLDIAAPVVFLGAGFYDSWGFRGLNGVKINRVENLSVFSPPIELSSAGSCVLFRTEIFSRGVRFRGPYQTGLLVGVCNDARALGYQVWALSSLAIIHPTSTWREQMWKIKKISIDLKGVEYILNADCMIAGAYFEFMTEPMIELFKNYPEIPFERGEYGFIFYKNPKYRTIDVEISNALYSSFRFKFSI
jgi:hypothetical protein